MAVVLSNIFDPATYLRSLSFSAKMSLLRQTVSFSTRFCHFISEMRFLFVAFVYLFIFFLSHLLFCCFLFSCASCYFIRNFLSFSEFLYVSKLTICVLMELYNSILNYVEMLYAVHIRE